MVWLLVLLIPIFLIGIAYVLAPETVWNDFIWRYYVAPIEADAQDRSIDGITESYNVIDTTTYGLVLVTSVLGIYRLLKRLKIRPGKDLVISTVPYILLGGVLRSLEDSSMFTGKAVYLFIAPVIYIFIGVVTIIKLVESHNIHKLGRSGPGGKKKALMMFSGIHVIWNVLYSIVYFLYINDRELLSAENTNMAFMLHPGVSVLLSMAAILGLMVLIKRRGKVYIHDTYAVFGWHFLALAFFHAMAFMFMGGQWPGSASDGTTGLRPLQIILIPMLASTVLGLFITICYVSQKRFKWLDIYWKNPVNVIIMYAHLFDAAATFTALQFFNYGEKHVLPNFLIQSTGTPAVMFPLKLGIMAFVVYVLEIELKDDLKRSRLLQSLVWIAIIMLGLAPGTRDLMRLVMGV